MNKQTKADCTETAEKRLDAKQVSAYLFEHPAFFSDHPELLAKLHVPHERGDSISLVEQQMRILREQLWKSKEKLGELLEIARENERLQMRMHKLTQALITVSNAEDFFARLYTCLQEEFDADCVTLRIFASPIDKHLYQCPEFAGNDPVSEKLMREWMDHRRAKSGTLHEAPRAYLFPEQNDLSSVVVLALSGRVPATLSQSGVNSEDSAMQAATTATSGLVSKSTSKGEWYGILAIGSNEATRFHAGLGVDLLSQQAIIISLLLQTWLDVS